MENWYNIYRTAGHMKYQLATINKATLNPNTHTHTLLLIGLEILPWTKILTLIIWLKDREICHEVMALVYSCWSRKNVSS